MKVEQGLTALLKQLGSAGHSAAENKSIGTGQHKAGPAAATDSIEVGRTARLLNAAEAAVSAMPVDDLATTEVYAASIADGSYHVNHQQVANQIFDFELVLERRF